MDEDLKRRVRRLEDREEIKTLVARYVFAVDNRDMPAIEACFAKGARFCSQDGALNAVGRDEVMAQFRARFSVLGAGAHYTHDHVVWIAEDGSAAFGLVSSHAELFRNGRSMIASLRYEDRYEREAGSWRFADRLLSFLYYVDAADYVGMLGRRDRMRAYEAPQDADFPEGLASWREYYGQR